MAAAASDMLILAARAACRETYNMLKNMGNNSDKTKVAYTKNLSANCK